MKTNQSSWGIASFVLALLPFTYAMFVLSHSQNILQLIEKIDNETLRESIGWMTGILLVLSLSVVPLLSAYLGIIGLLQKDEGRGLAMAGLIMDGLAVLILGLVYFVF